MEDLRTEKEILEDIEIQVNENTFTYKEFSIWLLVIFTIFALALITIKWWV